jgi:hypothetical protein
MFEALVRGCIARNRLRKLHERALEIQQTWRGHRAFKRHIEARQRHDEDARAVESLAVQIQSIYRMVQARSMFLQVPAREELVTLFQKALIYLAY